MFWGARFKSLLLCLMAVGWLSACTDPREANKENFTEALNSTLVSKQALIPAPGVPSTAERGMMVIKDLEALNETDEEPTRAERTAFRRQLTYAKLLQSNGLIKIEHGYYKQRNYRGDIVNVYGYKLRFNEKYSQDIVRMKDGKITLVAGYIGVKDIISFTKPTTVRGRTTSRVNYTRTVIGRPEWATDPVIEYSGIAARMKGQVTANLELDDSGWHVMGGNRDSRAEAAKSIRNALRTGDLRQNSRR